MTTYRCGSHIYQQTREFLIQTLKDLSWTINYKKSQLIPSKSCVFVGFKISSVGDKGPWIEVLLEKINKLKRLIRQTLKFAQVKAWTLAKIAGQCISMLRVIIPAKLFLHNMYRTISTCKAWDAWVNIDDTCRADLNWWLKALNNCASSL